jgi:hypothetical protein
LPIESAFNFVFERTLWCKLADGDCASSSLIQVRVPSFVANADQARESNYRARLAGGPDLELDP